LEDWPSITTFGDSKFNMQLIKFYIRFFLRFVRYYWRSMTRYDVHSPFVAEFLENVIEDRRRYYAFSEIRELQEQLRQDRRRLQIKDHGAGSQARPGRIRSVSSIARFASVSPDVGKMLFRTVNQYQLQRILELGTSLGISTLYLSAADSKTDLVTIEGCPQTAAVARENLKAIPHGSVTQLVGSFRERLPEALAHFEQIDLLFLDGDHRLGASVNYVESCLHKTHPGSIFILADIHWSKEMETAWDQIRRHPRVRISIDLFQTGILFFREEQRQPEHYTLIRSRFKPWRMGLFMAAMMQCCMII